MLLRARQMRWLDPDEERRRRRLRARILRRNRIKREIEQGLEPSPHRRGYDPSQCHREFSGDTDADSSLFAPAFGGDTDQHARSQDRYVAGTLRSAYRPVMRAQSPSGTPQPKASRRKQAQTRADADDSPRGAHKRDASVADEAQLPLLDATAVLSPFAPAYSTQVLARPVVQPPSRPPPPAAQPSIPSPSRAAVWWHDAFREVVFRHHEEILLKDPKRKWRQERFGCLLFERKAYAQAAKHLTLAIMLGASSSMCWRRLAQSHFYTWQEQNDWDALWDAKAAYEQAMNHIEIACNPFTLFEYARVLEGLGIYTGALSVCASILQTFPRFQLLQQVTIRFVLLQRYQLFSGGSLSAPTASLSTADAIAKEAMLLKCSGYTKVLLLDSQITSGNMYVCVLYMHARLNELLAVSTTSAGGGDAAAKEAQASSDRSFEELFRVADAKHLVLHTATAAAAKTLSWSSWKAQSSSYIALAGYFHDQNEPIAAADALARALELLDVPLVRARSDTRVDSSEQRRCKLSLYLALGRNFYQCNQMERAIRAMEAVFEMDPYHEEARASLAAWFPAKWKYRLDLEDASQTQIARVVRGIWGRNAALRRRKSVFAALEAKYRERPYHPLHRRNVVRFRGLRAKYAPLFLAQDISARRIQTSARRFLYYARIRWAFAEQRAKVLQQLKSKQQTRKFRYNRHVRRQLAQLLPDPYEEQFEREDRAVLLIQRCFRGERTRHDFRVRRDAHRSSVRREDDAARTLQQFARRYCRPRHAATLSPGEALFRAQRRVAQAKERVAWNLQQLYRRRRHASGNALPAPASLFDASLSAERQCLELRDTSATTIQRAWRRRLARCELGAHAAGDSAKVLVQQLRRGHERQSLHEQNRFATDLELAARKIQALYRGKRIRRSLSKIHRVPAPRCVSAIAALSEQCEANHRQGYESCVTLQRVQSVVEKRALFDHPIVVLDVLPRSTMRAAESGECPFPLQSVVSAIEHSAVLRCLVCLSGDLRDGRIGALLSALKSSRSLRVLALGGIRTDFDAASDASAFQQQCRASLAPEQDDETSADLPADTARVVDAPQPQLGALRRVNHSTALVDITQQRPMQVLSQALRTANFVLEELYMEDNALVREPADGACVADFLGDFFFARYGRLTKLVLARMRLSDANAALLGSALAINTVLRYLDLHGNAIGDNGSVAIATQGLAHNRTLTYLNLGDNSVGSVGAIALFACLADRNRTLETLELRNNNVRNDAIVALTVAWQQNAVIVHIDLRGNLVHSDHLESLRHAVDERRISSPAEFELRLFLARKRFSLGMAMAPNQCASSCARSPLKSVASSKGSSASKRPAKLALSPKAFLKQARQSTDALVSNTLLHSPLAVYKQQRWACSDGDCQCGSCRSVDTSVRASASTAVLALVSPARAVGKYRAQNAAAHASATTTKLPLIRATRASVGAKSW